MFQIPEPTDELWILNPLLIIASIISSHSY